MSSPAPDRNSPIPTPKSKILIRPKPSQDSRTSGSRNRGNSNTASSFTSTSTGRPTTPAPSFISILKREPQPQPTPDKDISTAKSKDKEKLGQNEKEDTDLDKPKDRSIGHQLYALVTADIDSPSSSSPKIEPSKILVSKKTIPAKPEQPKQPPSIIDLLQPYKFPLPHAIRLIGNHMEFSSFIKTGREMIEYESRGAKTAMAIEQIKTTTDFLVVTVIGPKHSGKSALLSYIANDSLKFDIKTETDKDQIFGPRTPNTERSSSFYITSDKIVLIEMSPIFNGFSAIQFIPQVSQYGTLENAIMSWNLRLMRWALVCSHLLIVVGSSVVDPLICQLVNSALSLYPMESVFGEGCHPELIFVGNKLPLSSVQDESLKNNLSHIMASPDIIGVSRVPRIVPNVFLLPHTKYNYGGYENSHYENLKKAIMKFNRDVRNPFSRNDNLNFPQRTTLLDWFGFASRLWEELGSPSVFGDYVNVVNGQV